jgi:hypothetical protein
MRTVAALPVSAASFPSPDAVRFEVNAIDVRRPIEQGIEQGEPGRLRLGARHYGANQAVFIF